MPFELTLQPSGKRYASVWLERSHGMFGELRAKGRIKDFIIKPRTMSQALWKFTNLVSHAASTRSSWAWKR